MSNKIYFSVLLFSLLTACTDNGILIRSNGKYQTPLSESVIYKVGDAYQIQDRTYIPQEDYTYDEVGEAGWYTLDLDHFVTANGEKYRPYRLTAMHKTLPLPSIVEITNLKNDKTVVVRVNERGPYVNNRLIDVSELTAKKLEFEPNKTTPVRVRILAEDSIALKKELTGVDTPLPQTKTLQTQSDSLKYSFSQETQTTPYYVQIGAFSDYNKVLQIKNKFSTQKIIVDKLTRNNQTINRVRLSGFESLAQARKMLDKVQQSGYPEATLIEE